MLARVHRIVSGEDLRRVSRRGTKYRSALFIASVVQTSPERPTRFGFIASKAVGGAVIRNTAKRRLRALAGQTLRDHPRGYDLVVRAQGGITGASVSELSQQWTAMVSQLVART